MNTRDLKSLVVIQTLQPGQDSLGQPVTTWATFVTVRANIKLKSGMETIKAGSVTSVVNASIRLRYRTDINAGMRVLHNSVAYSILAVMPDVSGREFVDLAVEVVT